MAKSNEGTLSLEQGAQLAKRLKENVEASIFGQEELIIESMCCLLAGGHILMTGAPGLAKTTLVRVFSQNLGLDFGRIQFTPDLLPSDIVGSEVLNIDPENSKRSFEFARGPVFTSLLLADEINRASPRTQSALLEAMQERACTVAGKRYVLSAPFMVFATQNPFESEGTFPLPEAQMDRFLVHTLVNYPSAEAEEKILKEHSSDRLVGEAHGDLTETKKEQLEHQQVLSLIKRCKQIPIEDALLSAINELVRSTRPQDSLCPETLRGAIWYGAGPRAGISLISTARAFAMLNQSESVRWTHIKRFAKPVLRHRLRLTAQAMRDQLTEDQIIDQLIERLEAHQHNLAKGL